MSRPGGGEARPRAGGDKLQAAVSRAARAQALLENELLRDAAIARHRMVRRACGSNPDTWALHMDMIRAVYGY